MVKGLTWSNKVLTWYQEINRIGFDCLLTQINCFTPLIWSNSVGQVIDFNYKEGGLKLVAGSFTSGLGGPQGK